ncbi:YebC/PmpR family DNA-binding transcriptional regulator [Candidatus Peregrinibacteria bacterium]|nr:YebC/PmpR family DNA-binding transcriptional regulator [Candidatus Peregrinibacteria bacterium]
MSGHSKWSTIKYRKGAADAAKGKIFTKHANLITIAAREGGGDPEMNTSLRLAIDNARDDNMPNANIERAMKRGTGANDGSTQIFEMKYEGYGPEGVAVIVNALTDNKNRTVASIRSAFTKNSGSLGESGCVSWMFLKKGVLTLRVDPEKIESYEMLAIESGADDFRVSEESLEIITPPLDFFRIKSAFEAVHAQIERAEITLIPKNTISIEDENVARKILALMDALENDEDVSSVSSNFDIPEKILQKIAV